MFSKKFCFTLLLLTLFGVLAGVTSAQDNADPLVQAADEAGLLHDLNLTQTVDGITVTLNWAYVDTQQLLVNYRVEGADPLMFNNPITTPIILRDAEGYSFSYASAVPQPDASAADVTYTTSFYTQGMRQLEGSNEYEILNDYFRSGFATVPDEIDLQFELTFGGYEVPDWVMVEGIESEYAPGDMIEAVGPFIFNFAVTVQNAVELAPMQTVEAAGLSVTLEALTVAPSALEAQICYDLPDGRDWLPEASVFIDGVAGYMSGHGITDLTQLENMERRCRNLRFDVFYPGESATITLTLDYLTTPMQEGPADWERIEDVLAEDGIDIDVIFEQGENGGGGIRIEQINVPDGFNLQEAMNSAREKLGDRVAGPWVFEVELP